MKNLKSRTYSASSHLLAKRCPVWAYPKIVPAQTQPFTSLLMMPPRPWKSTILTYVKYIFQIHIALPVGSTDHLTLHPLPSLFPTAIGLKTEDARAGSDSRKGRHHAEALAEPSQITHGKQHVHIHNGMPWMLTSMLP